MQEHLTSGYVGKSRDEGYALAAAAQKVDKPVTLFEEIENALSVVATLTVRIEHMADALVGAIPEADSKAGEPLGGPGLIGTSRFHVARLRDRVDAANAALSRIERALP